MKSVYLAGPDVFYPNAVQHGRNLVRTCAEHGLRGLFPLDNEIDTQGLEPRMIAEKIRQANIAMIRECDGIIANISPFRGPGTDAGTAYEIGYADALGKPVVIYSNTYIPYHDRIRTDASDRDNHGLLVENFGLPDNLMFGMHEFQKTFRSAVEAMRDILA